MIGGGGKLKIKNLKVVTVFGLKFQETKIFKVFKMLAVHNYQILNFYKILNLIQI